jgi:hypothetical protein
MCDWVHTQAEEQDTANKLDWHMMHKFGSFM